MSQCCYSSIHLSRIIEYFPISLIWKFLEDFDVWICPLSYSITCRITILFPPHCLNIFNIVLATSPIRDHTDKTEEWRCTNTDFDFSLCYHCCPVKILKDAMKIKKNCTMQAIQYGDAEYHTIKPSVARLPLSQNITLEKFRCRCCTIQHLMLWDHQRGWSGIRAAK